MLLKLPLMHAMQGVLRVPNKWKQSVNQVWSSTFDRQLSTVQCFNDLIVSTLTWFNICFIFPMARFDLFYFSRAFLGSPMRAARNQQDMTRKLLLLVTLTFGFTALTRAQIGTGTLQGTIVDEVTGVGIPFANVIVLQAGQQVTGASTDFDGKYRIPALKPATNYTVKVSVVGYGGIEKTGVQVNSGQIAFVDIKLTAGIKMDEVVVIEYEVPLIKRDGGSSTTVTGRDIEKMPSRGAAAAVTTAAGVQDNDGAIGSIRGTREGSTDTYIDGVKVRGSANLPQGAYEQVTVLTGGVPAQYGDATGGIIAVTTKGASRKTYGGIELLSSGGIRLNDNNDYLLDPQGYHLVGANLSGPLLSVKDKSDPEGKARRPLLGYFLAGEVSYIQDPRPSAIGHYYVNDDKWEDLQSNPIIRNPQGGSFLASEFTRQSDLEFTRQRRNVPQRGVVVSGNIDLYTTPNITFKVGGSLDFNDRRLYNYSNSLFNHRRNGERIDKTWRVFGRFTQRFGNTGQEEGGAKKSSTISNAYYSIQADYERYTRVLQDPRHGDQLFRYGYVGHFETLRERTYAPGFDEASGLFGFVEGPVRDTMVLFTPSDVNPELSAYTQQYYNLYPNAEGRYENLTQINQDRGALRNGDLPLNVHNIWRNTGYPYNEYSKLDQSQFRVAAMGAFDIKNHSISLGFEYEQRNDAFVGYSPYRLWEITRQYANNHLEQQDRENPLIHFDANGSFTDTISYNPLYTPRDPNNPLLGGVGQAFIDYNMRLALGLDPAGTDWLDIDSFDPSFFQTEWFSADELLNNGNYLVNYYGFDHTGRRLSGRPTFDSFFNERDENGRFTRKVAPFEPIYMSGYIQDEFTFKDLIFRVGVRVDRFDANQRVLKDPYSLQETRRAGDVTSLQPGGELVTHPGNIGSDAVVYVNDLQSPTAILGYREGDTWYNSQGTIITDPTQLRTGTGIAPLLVNPGHEQITDATAFKDYDPQINVMPRISFSFPISEDALFFANYDVLTQRPLTGNRLDLLDYLFIENIGNNIVNNPDLRPETTIEYAIGFKQKLSKRSAFELNAFYREMRDQITVFRVNEAYPRTYLTFRNLDFGTVKGLTLTYDLRRTNNIQLRVAYTLQFADGTGSSATTSQNLINAGFPNLRVTQPLDFDQRHNIVVSADYRFGAGKNYNGPKTTTKSGKVINWLENFGVFAIIRAGSGTPYSAQTNISAEGLISGAVQGFLEGSINGSAKPWQFRVDARIDRDFTIKWNKGSEEKPAKTSVLNFYFDLQNLLNTRNVINVYRATGNPNDDGYLNAAQSQIDIAQQTDEQSFRDLYSVKVNNPANFSIPRRFRVGLMLNF
jgi:hypothetical protein